MNLHKIYLKIYRILGFSFLISLTTALFFYGFLMIFFFFSTSWISPTVLSVTSDKMIQFSSRYQQSIQTVETLKATEAQAERDMLLANELANNLKLLNSKVDDYDKHTKILTKSKIDDLSNSYSLIKKLDDIKKQTEISVNAGLITKDDATRTYTAIQQFNNSITDSDLALGAIKITDETQAVQLQSQIRQAENDAKSKADILSASKISLKVAQDELNTLESTSYRQAMVNGADLAFVPYTNLKFVKPGVPVYNCYLLVIACYKIGEIDHVYTDEQIVDFPIFNVRFSRTVRGVFVSMKIDDKDSMSSSIIYAGGKPLLF